MGMILSRFRKKKSAIETLEKLENDIREIEENRSYAQMRHEIITKRLFLYSVGLYFLCGIIFYFQFTSTLKGKLLYLVPLAVSPLILYIIGKIISWYYVRLIKKNQLRLNEMKKMKKKILEEVMNKETYKVAKEILDKFSTENVAKSDMQLTTTKLDPVLRRRIIGTENMPIPQLGRNMGGEQYLPRQIKPPVNKVLVPSRALTGPVIRMPAPVLPLDRSYIDRVVEYLIGDGPNNRYALICSNCHSHNGMALKEEFEYIGFKCCYCFFYNPARKVRPQAPKLDNNTQRENTDNESDSDSDSKDSGRLEVIEGPDMATSDSILHIKKEAASKPEISQSPVQDYKTGYNNSEIHVDNEVSNNSEIHVDNEVSDNTLFAFENTKKEMSDESCDDDKKNLEDELGDSLGLNKIFEEETIPKS